MASSKKKLEFKFERTIPASPKEVFNAWLNPKVPGNIWNYADKVILNPRLEGFYYVLAGGFPHYGRFTKIDRPKLVQHTWVSPNTLGQESMVTVTFKMQGKGTLMTLIHSGIPDTEAGRGHEGGWNYFLDLFPKQFGSVSRKKK